MEAGITGTQTITVTEDKTAQAMGSGTLPVFATPAMIALMENTAYKSVADELEEGAGKNRHRSHNRTDNQFGRLLTTANGGILVA